MNEIRPGTPSVQKVAEMELHISESQNLLNVFQSEKKIITSFPYDKITLMKMVILVYSEPWVHFNLLYPVFYK